MENALAPALSAPAALPVAERFANPLKQLNTLVSQPAVKRSLPVLMVLGLVGAAALAWMLLATPPQRVLFPSLTDADKAAVSEALKSGGITPSFDQAGSLTVPEDSYHKARMLLAAQDLPKAAPGGYAILDQLPMGVSRAVEGERLRQARETELARSIQEIDAVVEARVHLAMPESSVFIRDNAAPSASVIVRLNQGRTLTDAQVKSIINLVASSVPGMKAEAVTIVDQMGALLSQPGSGDGPGAMSDKRIDFQRRVEDKFRAQLTKLLTPLVGPNNFSAEIQAEVDLDENQATKEVYDRQGALRAEQGNWTTPDGTVVPEGIPGALSNSAPAPSTLDRPNQPPAAGQPAPGQPPVDPAVAAAANGTAGQVGAAPANPAVKASESYARSYDLGKEVSVTRTAPGQIKRLSVAVLLREPDGGKPRSPAEIQQITQLVRAAVGFDPTRNDQVTVISRKFSAEVTDPVEAAWYEAPWVPMAARNATALIIALLVLFMGVRPLVRSMTRGKKEAAAAAQAGDGGPTDRPALAMTGDDASGTGAQPERQGPPPISIEMLDNARSYDERVGLVRGFTRDNPARAALAVRDMIKAE